MIHNKDKTIVIVVEEMTYKKASPRDRWHEHAVMKKNGWGLGWQEHEVTRFGGDRNDSPWVYKSMIDTRFVLKSIPSVTFVMSNYFSTTFSWK